MKNVFHVDLEINKVLEILKEKVIKFRAAVIKAKEKYTIYTIQQDILIFLINDSNISLKLIADHIN